MHLDKLFEGDIDVDRLTEVLDTLGHAGRVESIRRWDGSRMARLFEACKGKKPLSLDDFVPPSVGPLVEVIHYGKNSLAAFTHFQKRFCKPDPERITSDAPAELWGYNESEPDAFQTKVLTGPGYYIAHMPERADASPGEVDIDYRRIPPSKPEPWPAIVKNEERLGRFVYAGMVDVMRGISSHVSIGRANKGGKYINAWFVLCREDRPAT